MIKFLIFYYLLWLLYFYDKAKLKKEYEGIKNLIIEDNYNEILEANNKNPNLFFKFRVLMSFLISLILLIMLADNLSLYRILLINSSIVICYKTLYYNEIIKYQNKLKLANIAFPYYLNNLSMLISNSPVVNAIYDSIETAPTIFQRDLYILINDIHDGYKIGVSPYLDFANKYRQVDDLRRIMITLYNMNNSKKDGDLILTSLCRIASEKLSDANQIKLNSNLDKQALMPWVLFLWVGFVMIMLFVNIDLSSLGSLG